MPTPRPIDPLACSVFELMRPVEVLGPEDSIQRAASILRSGYGPLLPVYDSGRLLGAATEAGLAKALASGIDSEESVLEVVEKVAVVRPQETGAGALRALDGHQPKGLVVVDEMGRPIGVLCPSDLCRRQPFTPTPSNVGGMATPFGIYLVAGTATAGASWWALASTGGLLFLVYVLSTITAAYIGEALQPSIGASLAGVVGIALPVVFFLVGLRLLPISGIHGAEHKVVHTIERGEPLVPSIVKRMPRVHVRCGTNLGTAAMLFLGIATTPFIPDQSLRVILAAVVTLALWKRLGGWLQKWITTREPTPRQLENAIETAEKLLQNYRHGRAVSPSLLVRLRKSGIFHVVAGSLFAYGLVALAFWLIGFPIVF